MTTEPRQTSTLTGQMTKSINPIVAGLVLAVFLAALASARTVYAQIDNHCSRTSTLARLACVHEVKDDHLIEAANCRNIVDSGDRAECQVDAKEDRSDGLEECPEVFDARQDVCDLIGEARYEPEYDPKDFVDPADSGGAVDVNPYFPLIPGSMWVYEGEDEVITVEVTGETREIDGVLCAVVRDVVEEDGEVVEDTFDWYAQDEDGNVWYFGEISLNFEDGELADIEGSWETGRDHAKPGILIPAVPAVDDVYRQEFLLGEAEDMAQVVDLAATPELGEDNPANCSGGCLQTLEWAPIEPGVFEYKYYQAGIGMVREEDPESGETVELVEYSTP